MEFCEDRQGQRFAYAVLWIMDSEQPVCGSGSEIWIRCTVDLPGFGTATMWIRIQEVINLHERNFCKQKFTWKMLDFYFILVNFKSISFDKLNKKFNKICTVL